MNDVALRAMQRADWPAVAALIHGSTNAWYERHLGTSIFACEPADCELYCRVYEALDPGCCVLAEEVATGRVLGSCFYHPRPTHVALGIMNTHPDAFGKGLARRLLQHVVDLAERQRKPVRLVSSALNLDSFSLYNRAGFRPFQVYQDMTLAVPPNGFGPAAKRVGVRDATPEDVPGIVALEREVSGIEREGDYRYFLANAEGIWHTSVREGRDGAISGVLVSVRHAATEMLGPGVARDDDTAAALIAAELDRHRGHRPVWLAPADRPALLAELYAWGARNCELHVAQVLGDAHAPRGVALPTFMPETA